MLSPFLASTLLSLAVALYALRWRRSPGVIFFALYALMQFGWGLGNMLELTVPLAEDKIFWDDVQWVAFATLGPLALEFTLAYSRSVRIPPLGLRLLLIAPLMIFLALEFTLAYSRSVRIPPLGLRLLLIAPLMIFLALVLTNEAHGIVYPTYRVTSSPPFTALIYPYTTLTYAISLYGLCFYLACMVILGSSLDRKVSLQRTQTIYIAVGLMFPVLVIMTAGVLDLRLFGQRDWAPLAFGVGNLVIALGVFRSRLFQLVPIARDRVLDTLSDIVVVVDQDDRIVDGNAALIRAANGAAIIGIPAEALFPRWGTLVRQLRGIHSYHGYVGLSDAPRPVYDMHLSPVYSPRGEVIGRVAIFRNVTEQLDMEAAALEQERLRLALEHERSLNETKTHLMRRIAHEFRTPLAIMRSSHELLLRYGDRMNDGQRAEKLGNIGAQVAVLTEMLHHVQDSLLATQGTHIRRTIVSLAPLCRAVIDELTTTLYAGRRVDLAIAPTLEHVLVDRYMLRLWLTNLISNGLKYSQTAPVEVGCRAREGALILEVRDHGIGIPAESVEHLFEPFYRAPNTHQIAGIGLGLSLVRDTVLAHAGSIQVCTCLGTGTRFTITLPDSVIAPVD